MNPGECYKQHVHSSFIDVRACVNIDTITAKSAQFRENNYVKPPIYEEAYAYKEFYLYLKSADEKMNITKFSRIVGVSQDKIRKALWFCDLPKHLRDSVEKKYVSYSNALEIKRLIEVFGGKKKSLIEQEIDFLLLYPRIKHEDYKARVDMLIMDASQATLFDITPFQMTKKLKRRVVEKHYVYYLSMMARYTNKIQELKNMGVLGRGKLYSEISPKKQLAQIVHSLELIFPNFSFPPDFIEYIKTNITKPVS